MDSERDLIVQGMKFVQKRKRRPSTFEKFSFSSPLPITLPPHWQPTFFMKSPQEGVYI